MGCWAHARREFDEALTALPADKRSAEMAAREWLEFCNCLSAIERELEDATADERYQARLGRRSYDRRGEHEVKRLGERKASSP